MERFWKKVHIAGPQDCWLWTASKDRDGYGFFMLKPNTSRAHRTAWIITFGKIPKGLLVLHHCDTPSCVNPTHLFLGTTADNVADRERKGRTSRGEAHHHSTLKEHDIREIVALKNKLTGPEVARRFRVSHETIYRIWLGQAWKHITPNE